MSGLAALLAERVETGVYTWRSNERVEDVRHTVELAGWRFAHVDGWIHDGKAGFLAEIGAALEFGPYYGQNLDALHDCLSEIAVPTVVLWDGWTTLARGDERAFRSVTESFASYPNLALLLRGDGPELSELPLRRLD